MNEFCYRPALSPFSFLFLITHSIPRSLIFIYPIRSDLQVCKYDKEDEYYSTDSELELGGEDRAFLADLENGGNSFILNTETGNR